MKHWVITFVLLAVMACQSIPKTRKAQDTMSAMDEPSKVNDPMKNRTQSAVGIWRIPKDKDHISGKGWSSGPGTTIFKLDQNYLTLALLTEKAWMWRSADNYYTLKTEWRGDSLYYLPPFGRMTFLARFKEGRFERDQETPDGKHLWVYEKILEEAVSKQNRAIVKQRKVHNYKTKPTDKWR